MQAWQRFLSWLRHATSKAYKEEECRLLSLTIVFTLVHRTWGSVPGISQFLVIGHGVFTSVADLIHCTLGYSWKNFRSCLLGTMLAPIISNRMSAIRWGFEGPQVRTNALRELILAACSRRDDQDRSLRFVNTCRQLKTLQDLDRLDRSRPTS